MLTPMASRDPVWAMLTVYANFRGRHKISASLQKFYTFYTYFTFVPFFTAVPHRPNRVGVAPKGGKFHFLRELGLYLRKKFFEVCTGVIVKILGGVCP